ncbi:MAG: universal stress protein [Pseudomonadota bacterium]|nr:universal stress protein [Pseudomonadota bacterium]
MSYQCILVHVDDSESVAIRLGAAARLARAFDADLIGAYVVPTRSLSPSIAAVLPDTFVEQRLHDTGEAQNAAEALFRAAAARARLTAAEWRAPPGEPIETLVQHARSTDLVIVGQSDPDDAHSEFFTHVADALVLRSGRPVLAVPHAIASPTIGSSVLVVWTGSRESARAVADAMPMLARAQNVHLVTIGDADDAEGAEAAADQRLASWLRYHGIDVVARRHLGSTDVGDLILSESAELAADLIVMGADAHTRGQHPALSGATRSVLDAMTVPVLLAH